LIKRRISDSELARLRVGEPERVAYGQAEIERLDIYRTKRDAAPVFVFIHGGAWRSGRSKDFATPAEMFLAAGVHYVVPDFAWVQDVGGSLMVLADQVRRAIAWVYRNAVRFGIDPTRLYVGGQSSGGHLAAVALTTDWPRDFGLPADIIKGGMCISGMYDLTPVRLSARNAYVAFDDATVAALSPVRHGRHPEGARGVGQGRSCSRGALPPGGLLDERAWRAQQVRPHLGVQGSGRARPHP
jgi:arylformamidase